MLLVCEREGMRLDAYLAEALAQYTRSRIAKAIDAGEVTLNGRPSKPSQRLKAGDRIECPELAETETDKRLLPEDIPLEIVFEDEYLLVVDKPAGMVTHPGAGNRQGTLVNALLGRGGDLSSVGEAFRPGIVHRLDKDTSGLMIVAKKDAVHARLQRMIAAREVHRIYQAIVVGKPKLDEFTVRAWIGRHPKDRKKMAALPEGAPGAREARTDFTVLERLGSYALMEARLHTGRTHQVRVHLASVGLAILNDPLYGTERAGDKGCSKPFVGQALRAFRLDFEHPVTGRPLSFRAAMPREWETVLSALRAAASRPR